MVKYLSDCRLVVLKAVRQPGGGKPLDAIQLLFQSSRHASIVFHLASSLALYLTVSTSGRLLLIPLKFPIYALVTAKAAP
ncbi:hypothetical protein D3C84_1260310 [compost metagenome]